MDREAEGSFSLVKLTIWAITRLLVAIPLVLCAALLLTRPSQLAPASPDPTPIDCPVTTIDDDVIGRFAQLLRFKTVSNPDRPNSLEDPAEFEAMLSFLAAAYAPLWAHLEVEQVGPGGYSRMLTWRGTDATLLPVLFVSHYDVVPVDAPEEWTHPPFSGALADGYIWGRGALDVKYGVAGLLEAASKLLADGFTPQRTIIFSFGQDEECGGTGAQAAAALLASRGVRVEAIIDEGGVIYSDGLAPLTTHPVAMVGTAEKGFAQIEVNFHSTGGHSSMPPLDGSDIASQVSDFVRYLRGHPRPSSLPASVVDMLQVLGHITPSWWLRPLLLRADVWPFNWLLTRGLIALGPEYASVVRTSVAVTWLRAGIASNVLPQRGLASVNFRLLQGDSEAQLVEYLRDAVSATGVNATVSPAADGEGAAPSRVTPASGPHFRLARQAIQELWQQDGKAVTVLPVLLTGMTDSRHFANLSDHGVLRFIPASGNNTLGDLTVHGTNERALASSYLRGVCTYRRLIELFSAATIAPDERQEELAQLRVPWAEGGGRRLLWGDAANAASA